MIAVVPARFYSLRQLAPLVGVGFTYLSKVETGKLDFGDAPSSALIERLGGVLDADADQLLLMAGRIPEPFRRRVMERPEAFAVLVELGDHELDRIIKRVKATAT